MTADELQAVLADCPLLLSTSDGREIFVESQNSILIGDAGATILVESDGKKRNIALGLDKITNIRRHARRPRKPIYKRLRFSIRNLLLVATIIAMGLVIYRQHREISGLKQTLGDAGFLDVTDSSKYHAIAIPTYDKLTWRWRVWLPEGQQYQLVALLNGGPHKLGRRGFDPPDTSDVKTMRFDGPMSNGLPPGEHTFTVALRKEESQVPTIHFEWDAGCKRSTQAWTNGSDWPFAHNNSTKDLLSYSTLGVYSSRQQAFDGPEMLLLHRVANYGDGAPSRDGIMVWIEPLDD